MECQRDKNVAAYFSIPMIDKASPESFKTGETVTDTAYYKDGAGAWTSLAITDTFSEIGSTGVYEISLTAAEMNHDQIMIKCTATNSQDNSIMCFTGATPANAKKISDDATAADDLELLVENAKGTDHKILISTDAQDLSGNLDVNTKTFESTLDLTTNMKNSVNAECDTALTDYDAVVPADLPSNFSSLNISVGGVVQSNLMEMRSVAQSAIDLTDFADAGYDPATNKVQGVVLVDTTTAVTNEVSADAVKISGSSTAADNVEAVVTGTGDTADVDIAIRRLIINNDTANPAIDVDSTAGDCLRMDSTGGYGVRINSSGSNQHAVYLNASSSGGKGVYIQTGYDAGVHIQSSQGGGSGDAVVLDSNGGRALYAQSNATIGVEIGGSGSNPGLRINGGDTGHAVDLNGGATSGDGINITTVDGHGVIIDANGSAKDGIQTKSAGGSGIYAYSTGSGQRAVYIHASGSGGMGVDIWAQSGTGIDIDGSTGIDIEATTRAMWLKGGGTSPGVQIDGGGTSGDALTFETTDGHGISFNTNGSGKVDINTTIDANTIQMEGVTLQAQVGDNFDSFFQNSGGATSKIVDNVGTGGAGLTQQQVRDALQLSPTSSSEPYPANSIDAYLDAIQDKLFSGVTDVNLVQIDGQATNGNNATLKLKQLHIVNSAGSGIYTSGSTFGIESTGNTAGASITAPGESNGIGLIIAGDGTGVGVDIDGGDTAIGVDIAGGTTSGDGIKITTVSGHGIYTDANGSAKRAVYLTSFAESAVRMDGVLRGCEIRSGTEGVYILAGEGAGGSGIYITANNGGNAIHGFSIGGNGSGFIFEGHGSGEGGVIQGQQTGGTGDGLQINGGQTSGKGVNVTTTDGDAVYFGSDGDGHYGLNIESHEDAVALTGGAISTGAGGALIMSSIGSNQDVVTILANTSGKGVVVTCSGAGNPAIDLTSGADGIKITAGTAGTDAGIHVAQGARGINLSGITGDSINAGGNVVITGNLSASGTTSLILTPGSYVNHPNVDLNADQSGVTVGTVTDVTNQVTADVTSMEGISLSGKVGDNFNVFFQNAGGDTTKIVDNVGGSGGLTQQQVRDAMQLSPTTSSEPYPANSIDAYLDAIQDKLYSGVTDVNLIQIDGQATNGNNATLNLKQLNIQNSAGAGVVIAGVGAEGVHIQSTDASVVKLVANSGGHGIEIDLTSGVAGGSGIFMDVDQGHGIDINTTNASKNGINIASTQHGISLAVTGDGIRSIATSGYGANLSGGSAGLFVDVTSGGGLGSFVIRDTGSTGIGIDASGTSTIVLSGGSYINHPAVTVSGTVSADIVSIGGSAQSMTDLKDFADSGYDPATNKIEGVKVVDTTTTNTDMRGTDSALLASSMPTNWSSLSIDGSGRVVIQGTFNTLDDLSGADGDTLKDISDQIDGISVPSASTVADAVWNKDVSGYGSDEDLVGAMIRKNFIALTYPFRTWEPSWKTAGQVWLQIFDKTATPPYSSGDVIYESRLFAKDGTTNPTVNATDIASRQQIVAVP